jgi:hypothetical protein
MASSLLQTTDTTSVSYEPLQLAVVQVPRTRSTHFPLH